MCQWDTVCVILTRADDLFSKAAGAQQRWLKSIRYVLSNEDNASGCDFAMRRKSAVRKILSEAIINRIKPPSWTRRSKCTIRESSFVAHYCGQARQSGLPTIMRPTIFRCRHGPRQVRPAFFAVIIFLVLMLGPSEIAVGRIVLLNAFMT